jgi:hypothetical protein
MSKTAKFGEKRHGILGVKSTFGCKYKIEGGYSEGMINPYCFTQYLAKPNELLSLIFQIEPVFKYPLNG